MKRNASKLLQRQLVKLPSTQGEGVGVRLTLVYIAFVWTVKHGEFEMHQSYVSSKQYKYFNKIDNSK